MMSVVHHDIKIYGIKNCDTMKKARSYLAEQQIAAHFHDYRTDGVPTTELQQAIALLGWEKLINQRGTTWRGLTEADKQISDAAAALSLMQRHPAVIKRPLLQRGDQFLVGFDASQYQQFCL